MFIALSSNRYSLVIATLSALMLSGCGGEKTTTLETNLPTTVVPGSAVESSQVADLTLSEPAKIVEGFTVSDQITALGQIYALRGNPEPFNNQVVECVNDPDALSCDVFMPLIESVVVQYATERPRHHISYVLTMVNTIIKAPIGWELEDALAMNTAAGAPRSMSGVEKTCVIPAPDDKRNLTDAQKACAEKMVSLRTGGPQKYDLPADAGQASIFASSLYIASATQENPGNLYQTLEQCKKSPADKKCKDLMLQAEKATQQLMSESPLQDLDLVLDRLTYLVTTDDPLYTTVIGDVVE
jgi:hypothetical protein